MLAPASAAAKRICPAGRVDRILSGGRMGGDWRQRRAARIDDARIDREGAIGREGGEGEGAAAGTLCASPTIS